MSNDPEFVFIIVTALIIGVGVYLYKFPQYCPESKEFKQKYLLKNSQKNESIVNEKGVSTNNSTEVVLNSENEVSLTNLKNISLETIDTTNVVSNVDTLSNVDIIIDFCVKFI